MADASLPAPVPPLPGDISISGFNLFRELPFVGMAIASPTTKSWVQVNQTLCDFLGYTRDELLKISWMDLTHPDDRAATLVELERVVRGECDGYQLDKRYLRRDGRVVHASLNVQAVRSSNQHLECFIAAIIDITARVEAEAEARRSAALLERLSAQIPGVIYQYLLRPDGTSCFPFASQAMAEIYEVSPESTREDASVVFERLHPDDLDRVARSIRESADRLSPWACDYRVVLPIRGVRWLHGDARPERLPDGSIMWHGYISDSTEQHEALDALTRLQEAIDSSITGIAIAGLDGILSYVNAAFLAIWGYGHASQVIGRHASMFWQNPDEAIAVIGALQSTGTWAGELIAVCHDGRKAVLQLNASRFTDAEGVPVGMLASFADITETKRLQSELLQAKKMESVGRLAGGIAHDFNNLLTVMQASLDLAYAALGPDNPVRDDLSLIEQATRSAASLTRQLLAFSRRQIITPVVLDVNALVTRVSGMLQRLLGEQVALQLVTGDTPLLVRFDPGQAEQILVNLALNARDAMPAGGTLTIETCVMQLDDDGSSKSRRMPAGEYVQVAVSDTGSGMSPETLEHAFEPFFTTKPTGHGTGLGLAMIHGAVSQNGGRVQAYSEIGHGTSFKIYLPRLMEEVEAPAAQPPTAMPRGTETIALVEDDATVRALMVRLLQRQGYQVVDFGRGDTMLEWLRTSSAPLHLLLTDVIMPGMNGRELAEQVTALRPGTRVLYASGYTANVIVHHGILKPDIEFVAKPFTAVELATKVRATLDTPS